MRRIAEMSITNLELGVYKKGARLLVRQKLILLDVLVSSHSARAAARRCVLLAQRGALFHAPFGKPRRALVRPVEGAAPLAGHADELERSLPLFVRYRRIICEPLLPFPIVREWERSRIAPVLEPHHEQKIRAMRIRLADDLAEEGIGATREPELLAFGAEALEIARHLLERVVAMKGEGWQLTGTVGA